MKFYRGSASGARAYVEAGRSRADEYYLAEGEGIAARYAATADGRVESLGGLDGDAYEAWVAGFDPATGLAKGRVRDDANALRFCEVVVNGPKSWSLAAELHPGIGAAYDAAQARAAEAVVSWFGANATTRVGPRRGQVSTAVERVEACAVAHRTSRCGDPHRHIHLQVNARVFAEGAWRGIDSVAVRDSIAAVQGIGHAAVMCDPDFRSALAAHGYTLDRDGEIRELAGFVPAMSARHAQIQDRAAGYEQAWRAVNPDVEPGKGLRAGWDTRAWAEQRPDKPTVEAGTDLPGRWRGQLEELGWQAPAGPVELAPPVLGRLDRDRAARVALVRVSASRSGFNAADVRGEVEGLLARVGVVAEPGVRAEVAEDVTARAMGLAVPLLGPDRVVPGHVRAWTTVEALAVEAELTDRFAGRAASDAVAGRDTSAEVVNTAAAAAGVALDPGQARAVAALAGEHALVVVSGAAGAGKTTMLAATRAAVEADGRALLIVTPTLKAARGAAVETGASTGSAAWLVHQHGWRWDRDGAWSRLTPGQVDPQGGKAYQGPTEAARLARGGLLVVDEAGMLDQDTARALLTVADEAGVRLGLVGDVHQLPAVGRGGVLDLATRWTGCQVDLDVVHRFTRTVEIEPGVLADVPDRDYADLSLTMRQGAVGDPGAVFDRLTERGQVAVHADPDALRAAVADAAAAAVLAGRPAAVSAATNEAVRELNTAVRERLVAAGHVEDHAVAVTDVGQRIGAGDTVVTRSNSRDLDVANRDTWTVTAVGADGGLVLAGAPGSGLAGERRLPPEYVDREVELGYVSTVHGVQGATAHSGHLVLDGHTGAAAAYVGMTRGRTNNTVHVVAEDLADARVRWVETAGRDRADTGPAAARTAAELAAARYPGHGVQAAQELRLAELRDRLRTGWDAHTAARARAAQLEPRVATARADAERAAAAERTLAPLREQAEQARERAEALAGPAQAGQQRLDERAETIRRNTREAWDHDRDPARAAAQRIQEGPGRYGRLTGGHGEVEAAREHLHHWAERWEHVVPGLTPDTAWARAVVHPGNDHIGPHLDRHATSTAAAQLPEHVHAVEAHRAAATAAEHVGTTYQHAETGARQDRAAARGFTGDTADRLTELTTALGAAVQRVQAVRAGIERLIADPAVTELPDPAAWLDQTRQQWAGDRTRAHAADLARQARARDHYRDYGRPGPGRGRDGPDLGR